MPRSKQLGKVRADTGKKRENYKSHMETRGKSGKEYNIHTAFWRLHKMDDIMQMTPEELEITIDNYFEGYEQRQKARDKNWNWPTIATKTINEVRNKRISVDKNF